MALPGESYCTRAGEPAACAGARLGVLRAHHGRQICSTKLPQRLVDEKENSTAEKIDLYCFVALLALLLQTFAFAHSST